jgi:D-beta-D-heptose 7-phosphate kinase/D-beta-D-heptose 1-phosphate adenosyltransferase
MNKIVLVTGGFDPIHSGHIAYLKEAKKLGDMLVVGVNSDEWLIRKKGKFFLPYHERRTIIQNIKGVDAVIGFNDDDGTAKDAIVKVREFNPYSEIIFANGGDRTKENIPEMDIVDDNLSFVFGVGGEHKMNSSSWILSNWENTK